ncbi:unnamed protein product [Adineta steineri]|uniref:Uncharacterized protein n=1 Tax=Adineta steineri TaxID=433720 RepID=A0A813STY4_9BILA|nr:unnamed protein product [Adineta steineri]CAF0792889.1 unnamed protein product [Adineta steineri]CAF0805346.1 unnamed protein product [Adineta steineri]CAF0919619.1 unnamed protein product [Adineta steineri]
MLVAICIETTYGNPTIKNRMVRVANGCGAEGGLTINWLLQAVGEGVLIKCCNTHDICYETCGQTQSRCDNNFESCLNSACGKLGGWFEWWSNTRQVACKVDGNLLFSVVNAFGSKAFNTAQQQSGCRG